MRRPTDRHHGSPPKNYRSAGVDVERADRFVDHIRRHASPALSQEIGGFAGALPIDPRGLRRPAILTTTDGVGTKLLVAKQLGRYDTVGVDLVAMCVNDLIVRGATPLLFQDYIACGSVQEAILHPLMEGILRGCEQAGCRLVGGETAELPDMYHPDDIDLAGFSAGLVDLDEVLPRTDQQRAGDVLLGMPSSGIHSNGLSLARKVLPVSDWDSLLTETRIYVPQMKPLLSAGGILGSAHITGGGLVQNVTRVAGPGLQPRLRWDWHVPEVFERIRRAGVPEDEMRRVFNMGIGLAIIAHPSDVDHLVRRTQDGPTPLIVLGELGSDE